MHQKVFYQCEHCEHYIQHYNISEERIWKVGCGHCKCRDKDLKPSLRDCKYFKPINEQEVIEQKQQHSLEVLKEVEMTLKHLKLYLNKNQNGPKVDKCLIKKYK